MRRDELDPLPYHVEWPSLRSATGRVDVHSLVSFWVRESKLRGHYLEFGVGAGRSAVAAVRAHRRDNPESVPRFFLFDSFEGLPTLEGRDADSNQFEKGQFAFGVEAVAEKLRQHGVDDAEIVLVPGYFDDTLPTFDKSSFEGLGAAVVHVDVDLYGSARTVLGWVTPLLQQGTVILFDDWNTFTARNTHGERAAVREWLAEHPEIELESYVKYGWHGEAFLVHLEA